MTEHNASCALQVTMTEVSAAYNAFARTGAPPRPCPGFPELQLSYTDFAFWQRGRVQPGGGLESQVKPLSNIDRHRHLAYCRVLLLAYEANAASQAGHLMCIEKLLTAEAGTGSPRRLLCRGSFWSLASCSTCAGLHLIWF